jgi:hypothetical protein
MPWVSRPPPAPGPRPSGHPLQLLEQLGDWEAMVNVAEDALTRSRAAARAGHPHLAAVRVKARARARLGRHADASAALAGAVRSCLVWRRGIAIVLEASRALCASLRATSPTAASITTAPSHAVQSATATTMVDRRPARRALAHTRETVAVATRPPGHHAHVTVSERRITGFSARAIRLICSRTGVGHPAEHDAGGSRARGDQSGPGISAGFIAGSNQAPTAAIRVMGSDARRPSAALNPSKKSRS